MDNPEQPDVTPAADESTTELSTEVVEPAPADEAPVEPATTEAPKLEGKHHGPVGRLWHALTATPKRAALTALGTLVVLGAVIGLTPIKYTLLGWALKSSIDVRVTDAATHQLLPGTVVKLAGASVTTDKTGIAHFSALHPGKTTLDVEKPAYTPWAQTFTLGFGDQGSREAAITSAGVKINFKLTGYVSGKPVSGARVQIGDADAVSGSDGTVVASVSPDKVGQILTATITDDGFNQATAPVTVAVDQSTIDVKLVPAGQVYYLSNRSGKVDLYGANLDGSGATVLLAGSGSEDDSTGILPNVYDQSVIALVSSRAGHRVSGALQEDLYLFRPATKALTLIDSGINFGNYRTWLGKVLIYQKYDQTGAHSSIQAYDPASGKNTTVVTCTSDNACPQPLYSTGDLFIYSLEGAPTSSTAVGLFALKTGTTTPQTISKYPAGSAYRQTKSAVVLNYYDYNQQYPNGLWQSVNLETTKATTLSTGPASTASRTWVDSPGDKLSASIDKRDGQSDLYITNLDGTSERQLTTTGNVTQFVQWFGDDTIVYSAANQLFVISTAGGEPHKIANFYSGNVQTYAGGANPNY